ncbi:MAG: hypothetical protein EOP88_15635 [Verrucomicrobiaceae bacterium]|nr:MAG: hypothetical protein EOP88_15635 [Verrucomicrobiaceae bacterium]
MSSIPSDAPAAHSIEEGVNALLHEAKTKACEKYHSAEECVRESPTKAILVAVGAGYLLHRLPVRSLLVSQVRLAAALAPPVLFAFGAAKLCEYLQNQARGSGVNRRRHSLVPGAPVSERAGNVAGGFEYEPPV